jgi:hypothetical protein
MKERPLDFREESDGRSFDTVKPYIEVQVLRLRDRMVEGLTQ